MNPPRYTISILAHNNLGLTRACIESVLRRSADFELILTDNGSTDGTTDYFCSLVDGYRRGEKPPISVVHNRNNLGFIEPNRRALGMANGEFFVLLNNDTEVPDGWLEALNAPFIGNEKMALTGPAGGCHSLGDDFSGFQGPEVEYIEGACLMARTSIVRQLGLFAPYLEFCYTEDSDLSLRVRKAGYQIAEVDLPIIHHRFATSSKVPESAFYAARNRAICQHVWSKYLKTRRF